MNASATVQDDLPTLRSEATTWWEDHLRPLVDFKSFLRQRKAILANHDLMRSASAPYDGWKNPFAFALSASTLTLTLVAVIGLVFHALLPDPDLKRDWIARSLQTELRDVNAQIAHANPNDRPALIRLRDQTALDIADHANGLTAPHEGLVLTAGIPLVVYFLGVLFPRFVRKRAAAAPNAASARAIVFYYFTARTFWPMFLLATGGAIYFFLMKYSLWNTYAEVPQTLAGGPSAFHLVLVVLTGIAGCACAYAFVAAPVVVHKCASEMSAVLGIENDKHARHTIYWGLMRSVATASILAFTLTLLLVAGAVAIDNGTKVVRNQAGTALSIAPASQQ